MKAIQIELGGRSYELRPLPIKKAREWRKQLRAPFNTVVETLEQLMGAEKVEITNFTAMKDLIQPVMDLVLDSMDMLLTLLFDYSPELKADKKYLEEHATDEEALAALVEVVKLAYPFSSLLTLFQNGRASTAMKKSLPAPNGD